MRFIALTFSAMMALQVGGVASLLLVQDEFSLIATAFLVAQSAHLATSPYVYHVLLDMMAFGVACLYSAESCGKDLSDKIHISAAFACVMILFFTSVCGSEGQRRFWCVENFHWYNNS